MQVFQEGFYELSNNYAFMYEDVQWENILVVGFLVVITFAVIPTPVHRDVVAWARAIPDREMSEAAASCGH